VEAVDITIAASRSTPKQLLGWSGASQAGPVVALAFSVLHLDSKVWVYRAEA